MVVLALVGVAAVGQFTQQGPGYCQGTARSGQFDFASCTQRSGSLQKCQNLCGFTLQQACAAVSYSTVVTTVDNCVLWFPYEAGTVNYGNNCDNFTDPAGGRGALPVAATKP
eukprot:Hpha_TRINITY_DN3442_c0_g1::TRINITY_DN3442_c0_g1_i1::g.32729::m.32729